MTITPAATGVAHETRFRAMGTDAHLMIVGGDASLLARGEERVRELEQRWSRFVDSSEVNAVNRAAGRLVVVSAETYELVARALDAWLLTGGRFDPTVGRALAHVGYDRDFADLIRPAAPGGAPQPVPGLHGIELLPAIHGVILPVGVTIDAGGIGKGLAADLTATLLIELGADGAMVNLGGDLRVMGRAPAPEGWAVTVPDPLCPERELLRLAIADGAVATSSRLLRRWCTTTGEAHHLIDPRTGKPAETDVVAVTVVAAEGWRAEALTKSLFLAGPAGLADVAGHAVVVTADGACHCTPAMEATRR